MTYWGFLTRVSGASALSRLVASAGQSLNPLWPGFYWYTHRNKHYSTVSMVTIIQLIQLQWNTQWKQIIMTEQPWTPELPHISYPNSSFMTNDCICSCHFVIALWLLPLSAKLKMFTLNNDNWQLAISWSGQQRKLLQLGTSKTSAHMHLITSCRVYICFYLQVDEQHTVTGRPTDRERERVHIGHWATAGRPHYGLYTEGET